jgi:thiamine-monophosphate kinase
MPSNERKITDLGEKKLIKRILSKSKQSIPKSTFFNYFISEKSLESLSDDAALINIGENYLVVTSDMLFESSHFPKQMSYFEQGRKAVVVNLSDLAAMGARPIGILVTLGLKSDLSLDDFDKLVEGILSTCEDYELALLGGDINQSNEFSICGTAIGIINKQKVIMKSGARNGDILAVTGYLGLAGAGLEILLGEQSHFEHYSYSEKLMAIKHSLRPKARVHEGIIMSESGLVTSATDITDGLVSEIEELITSNAENIGVRIYEDKIPINPLTMDLSELIYQNPLELSLYVGEDFEILLTVSKENLELLKEKICIYEIGEVTSEGKIEIVDKRGKTKILKPRGYEHLH